VLAYVGVTWNFFLIWCKRWEECHCQWWFSYAAVCRSWEEVSSQFV